jgi:hypothetical protein
MSVQKNSLLFFFLFFSLFLIVPLAASAQSLDSDSLTFSIFPEYPKPYEEVTVTPASNLLNLSASILTLSVNGKVVATTTGTESSVISMGAPGQPTVIVLSAKSGGQVYTKKLLIRPADIALVIEPVSTTHPFYRGSPLVASEGKVRLLALPEFRTEKGLLIPSKDLVYTWKNGDQILKDYSGIGKSILIAVAPPRYRDSIITLTVSTQDNSIVSQSETKITSNNPSLYVYRNDPLLGPLFDTALPKKISLKGSEETFRSVPYFFSSIPAISWKMNGTLSESGQDITVRSNGGPGTAILGSVARGLNITDTAENSFVIDFKDSAVQNSF